MIDFEPASFKDPAGRVFYRGDEVFRTLSRSAEQSLREAENSGLLGALGSAGLLLEGSLVDARDLGFDPVVVGERLLRQRRLPFVSYAYEWSFEMLRDAALTTLRATRRALDSGFILKDAPSFNILFDGVKPLLIDTPSIERYVEGRPWAAYGQFCRGFLFPLLMAAHRDVPLQPLLRGTFGEVPVAAAAREFGPRDWIRAGVLKDVLLQSRLDRSFGASGQDVSRATTAAAYPKTLLVGNLTRLESLISSLRISERRSEWSRYDDECNYSGMDRAAKRAFVTRMLSAKHFPQVVDIGCNAGSYARLALAANSKVIALDLDSRAIDRLYLEKDGTEALSPIVANLLDPTPAMGWRLRERQSLLSRLHGDGFLALALIHHLRITGNVPLASILDQLFDIAPEGVVEWVDKADSQVGRMLSLRPDVYDDYTWASFERLVRDRADVLAVESTHDGARKLCHVRVRDN